MRVRAYLRVSTVEQADSGLGLEAQRSKILAEAQHRGWEDVEVYADEGVSGKSLNRPAMQRLLGDVRRGDVVVVSKLDRLSRSLLDAVGLMDQAKRRGWGLVALDLGVDTTTPTGRLVANVMASVAEWEREIIGQRTSEALQAAKAAGRRLGRTSLLPVEVQERIEAERAEGLTLQQIADGLNADAVPTPFNGKWWPSSIASVLRSRENDRIAGLLEVSA